jgi:hypothetical protein
MKATDFQEFCTNSKYGGTVLVQLKDPATFSAELNAKREIEPAQYSEQQTAQMLARQLAAQGVPDENIDAALARGGTGRQPMAPVPVLSGELEIEGELLILTYQAGDTKFRLTICPDDIKHITSPVNRHIHL